MAVAVGVVPIEMTLPAGVRLLDALAPLLREGQVESACLTLRGGAFSPFAYVIPAASPDIFHAAFYSQTYRPSGRTALDVACLTLGFRDGHPFFHCHAAWTEASGRPGCGHVLPDDTVIDAPIHLRGAGIVGACFNVRPDPETGFGLFMPFATATPIAAHHRRGVALRLAPNQDLTETLEAVGSTAGFGSAVVQGGVGSLIGARFEKAMPMDGFATEMLVRSATIQCLDKASPSSLDIALVDLHGAIGTGRLLPYDNPVLMTFEGLLEEA